MKSRRIPMSVEAFRRLAREPGWKYEYWEGHAHITPGEHSVKATLSLTPRAGPSPSGLRAPTVADTPELLRAYLRSFADGIEYCDWTSQAIGRHGRETLCGYFLGKRGTPLLEQSRVFVRDTGKPQRIGGAALIVAAGKRRARLDLLFVVPGQRGRGLATALVVDAVEALRGEGVQVLESAYVLGNVESEAWHHRFGFREEPDWLLARLRLAGARHELERRERDGNLSDEERTRLVAVVAEHAAQVARLEDENPTRLGHGD